LYYGCNLLHSRHEVLVADVNANAVAALPGHVAEVQGGHAAAASVPRERHHGAKKDVLAAHDAQHVMQWLKLFQIRLSSLALRSACRYAAAVYTSLNWHLNSVSTLHVFATEKRQQKLFHFDEKSQNELKYITNMQ
jgi:hypothetical protein